MDYFKYAFACPPESVEILTAFLGGGEFDTFEETPDGFNAYLPGNADQAEADAQVAALRENFEFHFEKNFLPAQNWNALWESNFQPVVVGDFCAVRADFHEPFGEKVKFELLINPKMAFGTGHHETTWMCLAALENLPLREGKFLDYGCGTGILAILASKLGASEIEAIDIEEESFLNTVENSKINGVDNVIARCGKLEAVEGRDFDGILANINRNVILDSLPRLAALTKPGGWLLVSGILLQDEKIVSQAAENQGFAKGGVKSRGNWLCMKFEKRS